MFFNMSQESYIVEFCRWTGPMIVADLKKRIPGRRFDSLPKNIVDAIETKFDIYDKNQFLRVLGLFRPHLSENGLFIRSFEDMCLDMLKIRAKDSSSQYYNLNGSIDFLRPSVVIESNGKTYATKQEMLLAYSGYINEAMFDNTGLEPITKYMAFCETEKLAKNLKFYELIETDMKLENPNMFVGVPTADEVEISDFISSIKAKSPKMNPDDFVEDIVEYIDETKEHYMLELFRIEFKMWLSEFPANNRLMKLRLLITAMASIRCLIRFCKNGYLKRYTMRDKQWNKVPTSPPLLRSFEINSSDGRVYFFVAEVREAVNSAHMYRNTGKTCTELPFDENNSVFNTITKLEFLKLLINEGLRLCDIEIVKTNIPLDSSHLPVHILSPTCSACIPTYAALIRIMTMLTVDWKVAYLLPLNKFSELRHYIDDLCEFFVPSKNNVSFIEYNTFQRLIEDGHRRMKPLLMKKETTIGDTNKLLMKKELKNRVVFRDDASKKLPKLEHFFDIAMKSVEKMTLADYETFSRAVIHFALMSEFPMIAKVFHRQKHCVTFGIKVCLLDTCSDKIGGDLQRCNLQSIRDFFQCLHNSHSIAKKGEEKEEVVSKQKTKTPEKRTPVQPGSATSNLSTPSASLAPPVSTASSQKNFLSEMKRGFFNKPKKLEEKTAKIARKPLMEKSIQAAKPTEEKEETVANKNSQPEKKPPKTKSNNDVSPTVDKVIEELGGIENMDNSIADLADKNYLRQVIEEADCLESFPVVGSVENKSVKNVRQTKESSLKKAVENESKTANAHDFCEKLKKQNELILAEISDDKYEMARFRTIVKKLLGSSLTDEDMEWFDKIVDGDMQHFLVFQSHFSDVFDVVVRGKEKKRYIRKKKQEIKNANNLNETPSTTQSIPQNPPPKTNPSANNSNSNVVNGINLSEAEKYLSEKFNCEILVQQFGATPYREPTGTYPPQSNRSTLITKNKKNESEKQKQTNCDKQAAEIPKKSEINEDRDASERHNTEAGKDVASAVNGKELSAQTVKHDASNNSATNSPQTATEVNVEEKKTIDSENEQYKNDKVNQSNQMDFESESEEEVEENGRKAKKNQNNNESTGSCKNCLTLIEKAIDDEEKLENMELVLNKLEVENSEIEMKFANLKNEMKKLKAETSSGSSSRSGSLENGGDEKKDVIIKVLKTKLREVENKLSEWKNESEKMFMETNNERLRAVEKLELIDVQLKNVQRKNNELNSKCRELAVTNEKLVSSEAKLNGFLAACQSENRELSEALQNTKRANEIAKQSSLSDEIEVNKTLIELGEYLRMFDQIHPVERANEIFETYTSSSGDPDSLKLAEETFARYVEDCSAFREIVFENILNLMKEPVLETVKTLKPVPNFPIAFTVEEMIEIEKQCKSAYSAWNAAAKNVTEFEIQDPECLICTFDLKEDEEITKCESCKRRYHAKCATKWLRRNAICPVCRCAFPDPADFPSLN